MSDYRGENHHSAVLTEAKVRRLRRMKREGCSVSFLSTHFGISKNSARHVVNRITWKGVE